MKLKKMSLRQKVGQLFLVTIKENEINGDIINLLTQYHVGGIMLRSNNLQHPKQIYQLTNGMQHYSNKELQLFIAVQQETASKGMTTVPTQQTLGNINNRLYTKQVADITGKEMKATGINMNLGPVLSLSKEDAANFSNDITHVAHHGRAMIEGYDKHGILTAAGGFLDRYKHIPSDKPLYKTGIQPYVYAIKYGLKAIQTANTKLAVPFLREELNFNGLIIQHTAHKEVTPGDVLEALAEGADLITLENDYKSQLHIMEEVFQAVRNGYIAEETINLAVNRIAAIKNTYHIDEPPAFNQEIFLDKHAVFLMEKLKKLQS